MVFSPYRRVSFIFFFFFQLMGLKSETGFAYPIARGCSCSGTCQSPPVSQVSSTFVFNETYRKAQEEGCKSSGYPCHISQEYHPKSPSKSHSCGSQLSSSGMQWGLGGEESGSFPSWGVTAEDTPWITCCPSSQERFSKGISTEMIFPAFGDLGQKHTVCLPRP